MSKTNLPDKLQQEITEKAEAYMHAEVKGMVGFEDISINRLEYAYEAGATEYAQRIPQWSTEKPHFNDDCLVVTATKIKENWEYSTWIIKWVNNGDGPYLGWFTGDGEEYGDLPEDLTADKYLILPNHE